MLRVRCSDQPTSSAACSMLHNDHALTTQKVHPTAGNYADRDGHKYIQSDNTPSNTISDLENAAGMSSAWLTCLFLPAMPPTTVKGKVIRAHSTKMTQMVPKGSAAVEWYAMATVLRKEKVMSMGPQNKATVSSTLRTCNTFPALSSPQNDQS